MPAMNFHRLTGNRSFKTCQKQILYLSSTDCPGRHTSTSLPNQGGNFPKINTVHSGILDPCQPWRSTVGAVIHINVRGTHPDVHSSVISLPPTGVSHRVLVMSCTLKKKEHDDCVLFSERVKKHLKKAIK